MEKNREEIIQKMIEMAEKVEAVLRDDRWHKTMLKAGLWRDNAAACYIPSCSGTSTVAVKSLESGRTNFYCDVCAEELTTEFPYWFERIK